MIRTEMAVDFYEGSSSLLLLLGHATGFCKEIWRPVVASLRELGVDAAVLAWDARGHGSSPLLTTPVSWWTFGRDLKKMIQDLDVSCPLVGVGHSMGGASVVMAEVLNPGSFSGLVLIEPVIVPPPYEVWPDNPLAVLAAKRRAVFPSQKAAAESYLAKPLFQNWHPDAFDGYLQGGFRSHSEGVCLALPPHLESEVFAAAAECGIFGRLSEVASPTRLLVSDHPGFLGPIMDLLPEHFPDATTAYLAGQNHLVVMERPDLIAAEIAVHLAMLRERGVL